MKYCCSYLKSHLEAKCAQHDDPWECPDYTLVNVNGLVGIPVRDGGSSFIQIDHCPWCGSPITKPGITKVVINDAIGGFSLSKWAVKQLYDQGSEFIEVNPYGDPNDPIIFHQHYNRSEYMKTTVTHADKDGVKVELADRYRWCLLDEKQPRMCPLLVKLVEEHGERANGECAELKIVEVPSNVNWHISEAETGAEWIAENHRRWGYD
tara:strand:+ start:3797 stop:4420 length:624 start_codon:yes stop_codon:yes gene_type:complete